jgi:hypothetical protein
VILVAEYLISQNKNMTRERALEIMKERRPQANPLRQFVDCLP